MCLKIYELDSSLFDIAPGLAWASKKTKVKLDLLTEINVISNRKKVSRKTENGGGICHTSHQYMKANNKRLRWK